MNIFDYNDYKKFVNDWIGLQTKGGHGQLKKISEYLGVHSVVMSQVFRGNREISVEHALGLCQFMGLVDSDQEYFLLLVQYSRAGTHDLKGVFKKQIEARRTGSQKLKSRLKHQELTDDGKATFYSHWYYSAIRLGLSIPEHNHATAIAEHLKLERSKVSKVIQFLLQYGLIKEQNGKIELGPQVTHVGVDSPYVHRHHSNWRLQALQSMEKLEDKDLFYTGPMVISKQSAIEFRKALIELIERLTRKAAHSESEVLQCLNIDWFQIGK